MIRNRNIDALKVICAFLVVCIHIPFRITEGHYIAITIAIRQIIAHIRTHETTQYNPICEL